MGPNEAAKVIDALYESWAPSLFRYAYRLSHSPVVSEDLVQEAFFSLYQEIRKGRVIENRRGWTLMVVRNQFSKLERQSNRHPEDLQPPDFFDEMQASDSAPADSSGEPDDVLSLLSQLSSRESEVLLLRLQSIKYKDIAKQLGISDKTVSTLLARALRKMRLAANTKTSGRPKTVRKITDGSRTLH